MPRYIGLDVHKRFVVACALYGDGEVAFRTRFNCTREGIIGFADQFLEADDEVVMEVTTHTNAVSALLTPSVARVVVSNPKKTRAIAEATIKTDSVDARTLADLLRCRYISEIWQPPEHVRSLRSLMSTRESLVGVRTKYTNRARSVLQQNLIDVPTRRFDSQVARQWLAEVELPEGSAAEVQTSLQLIDKINSEIEAVDKRIRQEAHSNPQIQLLMTLPGVGVNAATSLFAAIGDISRFRDSDHLVSYIGLSPKVKQSGGHSWYGHITKCGNVTARKMMILAARRLATHQGPLGHFYRRLSKRKHGNVAAVAAARKLVVIAYYMLRNDEPYRYAEPKRTQEKLDALYTAATGKRISPSPIGVATPSTPPSEGTKYLKVRSLSQVCERAGIPKPGIRNLAEGERKATEPFREYIEKISEPRVEARKSRAKGA